ncbi:MAG: GGDEF domain-containing protein [Roseiarcus sp.]
MNRRNPSSVMETVGRRTLTTIVISVTATAAALWLFAGSDFAHIVNVAQVWRFSLAVSFIVPLVVSPAIVALGELRFRELRRASDDLARAALEDPLTGLLNRRGFEEAATAMLARRSSVAAIMCDIDRFKSINDAYGHDFGDVALSHVAQILVSASRGRRAAIGRRGGEEFAILIHDCGVDEAVALAEAMREACETVPVRHQGREAPITISLGVAVGAGDSRDVRSLLARADLALYRAKREGRNRTRIDGLPLTAAA